MLSLSASGPENLVSKVCEPFGAGVAAPLFSAGVPITSEFYADLRLCSAVLGMYDSARLWVRLGE